MIKAALFDVDGTLVDSNVLHVEAWREAFSHYGRELSAEAVHAQIGKGGDQLMPVFLSRHELERIGDELEKLRMEIFARDYLPGVQPFPKVRELFERLKSDGVLIALATSAKEDELASHIETLGVSELVDAATNADDVERSKPCPDVFQAALARLDGVRPEDAIVIGDTPYDAIAARRTGLPTIGLLSGGFPEEALREAGVVAIYADIADLLERYPESPFGSGR